MGTVADSWLIGLAQLVDPDPDAGACFVVGRLLLRRVWIGKTLEGDPDQAYSKLFCRALENLKVLGHAVPKGMTVEEYAKNRMCQSGVLP